LHRRHFAIFRYIFTEKALAEVFGKRDNPTLPDGRSFSASRASVLEMPRSVSFSEAAARA
jgi:hypothetical protein